MSPFTGQLLKGVYITPGWFLYSKINRNNYEDMKENIKKLSTNDEDVSSTNFLKFIENFENNDDSWIDEINNKL